MATIKKIEPIALDEIDPTEEDALLLIAGKLNEVIYRLNSVIAGINARGIDEQPKE